jgi:hypothetical protein
MKTKHTTILLTILVTMALLAGCKKEDTPASVAFEGTYTTTNEVLNPAPSLKQRSTGISQTKPLDISRFVAIATITIAPPPPFKVSGDCTFYADNGDTFITTFTGTSIPNPDGTSTVELTHTITSGTGKFAKASGTFVGNAIANPAKPTGEITYKGTITY